LRWSADTGQQILCFDSCQLTITLMSNIKDVPMAMELLSDSYIATLALRAAGAREI